MLRRSGVILLYHRVATLFADPQLLAITQDRFAQHMRLVSLVAKPVSLTELLDRAAIGENVGGLVAVTFDDGYADNLLNALPILERYQVPATFFVSTAFLDKQREYWWDELEQMFLGEHLLPEQLTVLTPESSIDIRGLESGDPVVADWNVHLPPPSNRHRAYLAVAALARSMAAADRLALFNRLWEEIEGQPTLRASHRPLTPEELRTLARSPFAQIGAHSVWHPSLAGLSPQEQEAELVGSKEWLAALLGNQFMPLAYPFGNDGDISDFTEGVAREAGFLSACANSPGRVNHGINRFRAPRILVGDWGRREFLSRIVRMFLR